MGSKETLNDELSFPLYRPPMIPIPRISLYLNIAVAEFKFPVNMLLRNFIDQVASILPT